MRRTARPYGHRLPARPRPQQNRRSSRVLACLAVVGLILGAGLALAVEAGRTAADDGATLTVVPSVPTARAGETFRVDIVQHTGVPTTGAQLNLSFDPGILEVVDVKVGPAYADALFTFGSPADGSSATVAATVAKANETGTLLNLATLLIPGNGAVVAPGDAVVVTVTMKARSTTAATSGLELKAVEGSPIQLLEETGSALPVLVKASSIGVLGPNGEQPAPTEAVATPTPNADIGTAHVEAVPGSLTLDAGSTATLALRVTADGAVNSVTTDLVFDRTALRILDLRSGPGWDPNTLVAGNPWQNVGQVIDEGNQAGQLGHIGITLPADASIIPPGEGVFAILTVRALVAGTSAVTISRPIVLDVRGVEMTTTLAGASVVIGEGGGVNLPLVVGIVALLAVLGAAIAQARSMRRRSGGRWSWPFAVSLVLALIPVALFAGIIVMLVVNSAPVLDRPGLGSLLGSQYSSRFSGTNRGLFGLLPALSGTIWIVVIAIVIALPASLAMAIVTTEFPMGPLGRVLRPLVAVLSGIPPILYAISGVVFVSLIMIPKFAGNQTFPLDPTKLGLAVGSPWPPPGADVPYNAGAYPWDPAGINNSTLLGGALIGLLLIPFLTPLLADALRNVPTASREASLALGATRGYTLRRISLPIARPAMVAAVMLGGLKALGDTLIIAFAVGWEAQRIPNPFFDVLEKTPALTAEGAGLLGAFQSVGGSCSPTECAVGYSTALVLLVLAGGIVLALTVLQLRWRRGLAA